SPPSLAAVRMRMSPSSTGTTGPPCPALRRKRAFTRAMVSKILLGFSVADGPMGVLSRGRQSGLYSSLPWGIGVALLLPYKVREGLAPPETRRPGETSCRPDRESEP